MSCPCFLIHRPDGGCQIAEIATSSARIGRAPDNEIVLADSSLGVSRLHAEVAIDAAGNAFLTDLQSSNGTFLNDQRLNGATMLKPDDVVRIGEYRLVFQPASGPADREPAPRDLDIEMSRADLAEIAALRDLPRTASVLAEEPSVVLQVPAAVLRAVMLDPRLGCLLLGKMNERMLLLNSIRPPGPLGMASAH